MNTEAENYIKSFDDIETRTLLRRELAILKIRGGESAVDALRDFAQSLMQDIIRVTIKDLIRKAVEEELKKS